jgi:hypothetical protein
MALQDELAGPGTPREVLATVERAAAARRGRDQAAGPEDFTHPRFWAPYVHVGLP